MADHNERACQSCGSLLHHEDDCFLPMREVTEAARLREKLAHASAIIEAQDPVVRAAIEMVKAGDARLAAQGSSSQHEAEGLWRTAKAGVYETVRALVELRHDAVARELGKDGKP